MKFITASIPLGLALMLAGCASFAEKVDRVETGMSREEVISMLGQPAAQYQRGNLEYLTYFVTPDPALGEQPYMVRLLNRQVETVGRFVQLADLEHVSKGVPYVGMGVILPLDTIPDALKQLRELAAQRERGAISEADYQKARQEIIASAR